ncbi:MAG: hypothetical protein ABFS23_01615 [Pseudomonadota bacterium]
MKTLIAAASLFALSSGVAAADWEDVWGTDELKINHEGYILVHRSATYDPLEIPGNPDLYAGGEGGDVFGNDEFTSLDHFVQGNPDYSDVCGCI